MYNRTKYLNFKIRALLQDVRSFAECKFKYYIW